MSHTRIRNRRGSHRILSRLYVRGLGADCELTDRLGDLSLGGVGFEFPRCPEADTFLISFSFPGDSTLLTAFADVIYATPMPGTLDRESPFFVHTRFRRVGRTRQRWVRRLAEQRQAPERLRIVQGEDSLAPRKPAELPLPKVERPPIQMVRREAAEQPFGGRPQGGVSQAFWRYLRHDDKPYWDLAA